MADASLALTVLVVLTAIGFDFTNGFHDTANAMATTIATGALRPRVAVGLAAILNFAGAFISVSVAATIANGIVDQGAVTLEVVFAGLAGAILWNVVTWFFGIPSSSSHALIGGVIGATLAAAGSNGVLWKGLVIDVISPGVLAVLVAGFGAWLATRTAYAATARVAGDLPPRRFRLAQVASSSMVALAHGTNDAQKTMGVIVLALVAGGRLAPGAGVPTWVKVVCAVAIAAGTYSGGWRVIRTLGKRVTEIQSPQGFASETASSATILASSFFGFPLSTTQVVAGGVMGAGLGRRGGVVRWAVAGRMGVAWVLTLPMAGLVGAAGYGATTLFDSPTTGVVVVGLVMLAAVLGLCLAARRTRVGPDNVNDEADAPVTAPLPVAEGAAA
jgi:inorganic phosphate transporter, PiT family